MSFLASTYFQGYAESFRGNFTGQLWLWLVPEGISSSYRRIYFPPGVGAIDRRPSAASYGNRVYLSGGHSANLMIDEEFRCVRQGMPAPNVAPSVAVGAGTTPQQCYTRFYDEVTGEISPLSDPTSVTGDLNRAWTNLPGIQDVPNEQLNVEGTVNIVVGAVSAANAKTNFGDLRPGDRVAVSTDLTRWAQIRSIADQQNMVIDDTVMAGAAVSLVVRPYSRASHIELWVSVFGSLPRRAVRARLGFTAISESTATLALGIAEVTSFTAMPRGDYNLIYNDRLLVAGVDGHRDTIYLSAIGFPERNEGLAFITKYNEEITGMFRYRDVVVGLCSDPSYKLQGYTEDDFSLVILESDIGGFGHHANKVVEDRAFVPSQKGFQLFNGAFHPGIPKRYSEFLNDYGVSSATRFAFEEGFAVVNPIDRTYQFYPVLKWLTAGTGGGGGGGTYTPSNTVDRAAGLAWIAAYDSVGPDPSGGLIAPDWTSDSMGTPDGGYVTSAAFLTIPGERIGKLYRGTSKGRIYVEDTTNTVALDGESVWALPHYLMGDPGGGEREGKMLIRTWSYLYNEDTDGVFRVWAGDEFAYGPDVAVGVPNQYHGVFEGTLVHTKSQVTLAGKVRLFQAKVVREHIVEKSGRGFTLEYRFTNPKNVRFIGVGGVWQPGDTSRPALTVVDQGA